MNCKVCGTKIPAGRIKAIPGTKTCVNHSSTEKLIGIPFNEGQGDHCYTDLLIVTPDQYEQIEYYKKLQQEL